MKRLNRAFASPPISLTRPTAALAALLTAAALASPVQAEPAACLSPDPSQWPAPSKPYFMIALDTSGSMGYNVPNQGLPPAAPFPPCPGYPGTRIGHARCGLLQTFQAFSGQVNFGLATYTNQLVGCSGAACFNGCSVQYFPGDVGLKGCGPEINGDPTTRRSANILVPMLQDHYWQNPPDLTNLPELVSWVDNDCTNSKEVFGIVGGGNTPLNGMLRDMYRYFSAGWTQPGGAVSYPSPLGSAPDERGCRSVNVILITDGDEDCDTQADVPPAAAALLAGFSKGGLNWSIKTYVINFIGGLQANTDAIAAAGGTGKSVLVSNATQLSTTLSNIIGASVAPEICDNTDNNCNGCTDEGYQHYCDLQPICCSWATPAQRATCLTNFKASISAAKPQGDPTLLPCTTAGQKAEPTKWLCYDPGDTCDSVDNNCNGQVDENITKCGNPLHCPTPEVCNGLDDDCNGLIDEGAVCGSCQNPSTEICDGCDNNCNSIADDNVPSIPCGLPSPPNCMGLLVCPSKPVGSPGACVPGGGYNACNNNPLPEACDGVDNNCNGIVDDGIPSIPCVPAGQPGNLDYGPNSQCKKGTTSCVNGMTVCNGFVGPSAEICDGVDNNCNGVVDDSVPGTGLMCGINQMPCKPGLTACVNGALVCQGGVQPQPEVCDGVDNNCDGSIDESPLADAPAPGMNGCWTVAGNCCQFPAVNPTLHWCPPSGGTCNDNGALTPPCSKGTLVCAGAGWICSNPKGPIAETCDGIDNNCNGVIDDGNFPQVGLVCGKSVGECKQGLTACTMGTITCVGATDPTPEICDGKDNDCDGQLDNGVSTGGPCDVLYDKMAYPGDRSALPCQPGILQCNGMGGVNCVGGVGPSPEVCDAIDNDCDGQVDEVGPAPDGITGSQNPNPPPIAKIGDDCGVNQGVCTMGKYGCVNGTFSCLGGQSPAPETCDCLDNDCNGQVDNPNPNGPALCSAGKDCVDTGSNCQCAAPCNLQKEFPCPPGQDCKQVDGSQSGMPLGTYCISDPCAGLNCAMQKVMDANNNVVCAPAGTVLANCVTPPVCACKGQSGCQDPCLGVTCQAGMICAKSGQSTGKCVVDNCYNNPCQGCGKACDLGACVDDPCKVGVCPPDQACKPSPDFMTAICVPSCAAAGCASDQVCVAGVCVATCNPACPSDQTCDMKQSPPSCVPSKCPPNPCPNGGCCDPLTGVCGNCPCDGVVCPDTQVCQHGDCFQGMGNGSSSSAASSSDSGAGSGLSTTTSSSGGQQGAGGAPPRGVWGLATGGGGCACSVGPGATDLGGRWAFLAVSLALTSAGVRRRRRS